MDANGTISEHVKDINELRTQVSELRVRASRSRSLQYCPWLTGLRQRWTASRQSSIPLSARSHKAVDNLEVAFE